MIWGRHSEILARPAGSPRGARGLTLIEALVSVALLIAVILAVAQVFSLASDTAGRTLAQSEMIEAANAFESAVRDQMRRLMPAPDSLLLIESPVPVFSTSDLEGGYVAGGGPLPSLPIRHDRLVFVATSIGAGGADFESATDRSVPSANPPATGFSRTPFRSSDALVYFGPGLPVLPGDIDGRPLATLAAREWILAQRTTLLGAPGSIQSFTGETAPAQYPLAGLAVLPPQGLYACGIDAVQESAAALVARVQAGVPVLLDANFRGLWSENLCPATVNDLRPIAATDNLNYYGRSGYSLQSRISDLRIEWTDGSTVDPAANPDTQWFGQVRDTGGPQNGGLPNNMPIWTGPLVLPRSGDSCAKRAWLEAFDAAGTAPESAATAFGNPAVGTPSSIETFPGGTAYRAVWTAATWNFRPTALRFTFRVVDVKSRIKNEENVDVTVPADGTADVFLQRPGLQFSFVVTVP